MARQSMFERLATCTIGVNGSAQSVVSQSGCSHDEKLSPKDEYQNLVRSRHRIELVLRGHSKSWVHRAEFVRILNDINEQQAALRKQHPRLGRNKKRR
ncbi:hypothetical protein [Psychrobacter sp. 16-MNA-CIBAN-0192]|uniref:hypothetical protein n=1 Tax=Psychrobacter sp. 16-MNA-CIBAN-0192 TaxID=3140448 RepID=UPI003329F482